MDYINEYYELIGKVNAYFEDAMVEMSNLLQKIGKPIEFGNMIYSTCKDEYDVIVPAYCYRYEYEKGEGFKPIYDRYENYYYGWNKKEDVLKIFDALKYYIDKNNINN